MKAFSAMYSVVVARTICCIIASFAMNARENLIFGTIPRRTGETSTLKLFQTKQNLLIIPAFDLRGMAKLWVDKLKHMSGIVRKTLLAPWTAVEAVQKNLPGCLPGFWTTRKTARALRQASEILA